MSNKKYRKPVNTPKKKITRESIIIAVLIGFILGYGVRSLADSGLNVGSFLRATQGIYLPEDNISLETNLVNKVNANPNDLYSWIQLGNLYFDSDQYENAVNAYSRALQLDPENANVQTDLGVMYRRLGRYSEALDAFEVAQRINPIHEQSAFNKGIVLYFDMGNKIGAVETWKKLIELNPRFEMPDGRLLSDYLKSIN